MEIYIMEMGMADKTKYGDATTEGSKAKARAPPSRWAAAGGPGCAPLR